MERIYYLRQNYNQLKRKQDEEYIKRQNLYYIYMKKYYEEYVKNQKQYYLDKKIYYQEYVKRQKLYYLYIKKYYEEYIKNQNKYYLDKKIYYEEYAKIQKKYYLYKKKYGEADITQGEDLNSSKTDIMQSEDLNFSKTYKIKENNISEDRIESNTYGSLEINIKENNLEYKKNDSEYKKDESNQYNNLENENCTSITGLYNEEYIEEKDEKCIEEKDEKCIEEKDEKCIEEKDEECLEEDYNTVLKEGLYIKNNTSSESIYVKFPVILAETNITIPIEATIALDQVVMGIKEIKNNIFLTQSRLIPFSSSTVAHNSGILFIAGFIRKNIEYETKSFTMEGTSNFYRNIRQCTVEVPFNFNTRIDLLRLPIFIKETTTSELEFFTEKLQKGSNCKGLGNRRNPYEKSFVFREVFNEKPFVELVKATFIEVDIHKNQTLNKGTLTGEEFKEITQKTIVNLTLKVLQKQQLRVAIE